MLGNLGLIQNFSYLITVPPPYTYAYKYPASNQNQVMMQPYFIPVARVLPTPRITQHPATPRNTTNFIPGRHQTLADAARPSADNYPTPLFFGRNADMYNMQETELLNVIVRMDKGRTYQVTEFLSKGTFGKTFKVWSTDDARYLAMKIVDHSRLEIRETNMNEVRMLQMITQKSKDVDPLLRLIEYQETEKSLLIVTELLHEDVAMFMTRVAGPKCIGAVQRLANQLLTAVHKIHSMDLVHADLIWNNVMYVNEETELIKVIDYGDSLTKIQLIEMRGCEELQAATHRAPEVFLGLPLTEKIDIWSVGIMLIEFLAGRRFFQSFNHMSTIWAMSQVMGVPREFAQGFHFYKLLIPVSSRVRPYEFAREEEINVKEIWYNYDNFDALHIFGTRPHHESRPIDDAFSNLLSLLLEPSASDRISAIEALRHPFFAEPFPIED